MSDEAEMPPEGTSSEGEVDQPPVRRMLWPEVGGDWFVLRVKSRQEKVLHADLRARDLHSFLPLVEQSRVYGHRKSKVQLPLFPGYVFLKGQKDDAYTADRTRKVVNILDVPGQDELAWQLASVEALVNSGASIAELKSIVVGTPVEVRTGQFRGFQGVVESLKNPKQLVVQIDYMHRALSLQIDACEVEPLHDH